MKSLIPWKWGQKNAAPARNTDWFDTAITEWEDPFKNFFPTFNHSFSKHLPSVDVSEDKKEIKVKAEIPGMTEKDIDLTWHDGVLSIRGEKKDEKEEKKQNRYYRECSYGSFCRNINIGTNVDWNKTKAKYKHGVLTVTLPKTETAKKAIEIKVN
jgi:HSP20 family protein